MENSGLIEVLKTLSPKELKDFSEYLSSDFLNRGRYRKEAKLCLDALRKYAPTFDSPQMSKEKIAFSIWPDQPFLEGRMEKVMVEVFKSLRGFLLYESYFDDSNLLKNQVEFSEILIKRNLSKKAANQIQTVQNEMEQKPAFARQDYELLYRISLLQTTIDSQKITWKKNLSLANTLRKLDLHYLSNRIVLLNQYSLRHKLTNMEMVVDLQKENQLLALFNITIEESPTIYIALQLYKLYLNFPDVSACLETYQQLKTYGSQLDNEDLKHYYSFLRSYLSLLLNFGHEELRATLLQIQKENLKAGYFYVNNLILPGSFFSIASTAIRSNNFDWAFKFIETHKARVFGDNETNDYYRLTLAYYFFYKKELDLSLDLIPAASTNLDFHLFARRLELMVYYETNSTLLSYKVDAFKMYLSRGNKKVLSDETYESNNNFLNLLIQIIQSKPGDKNRQNTLLKRIEDKKIILRKDWLVEKINQLK